MNKVPLMQELISGPFDADKLDLYAARRHDGRRPYCYGTRLALFERFEQSAFRNTLFRPRVEAESDRRRRLLRSVPELPIPGRCTLDELPFGRILLFPNNYIDIEKVRAAEGMVSILLSTLAPLFKGPLHLLPYALCDDQLLNIAPVLAFNEQFELAGETNGLLFEIACEISRFLETRRLFVRAFAFAKNMPGDPYRNAPEQMIGADKLLRSANVAKKRALAENIARETALILKLLNEEHVAEPFVDKTLLSYVYIDPPEPPSNAGKIPQAYLIGESKRVTRFRDASSEMRSWADAYLFAKDIGFVFCPAELKPYVYIASETVVRRDFNIRTPASVFDYIKEDRDTTQRLKQQLLSLEYYQTLPHDIRPKANRLLNADIPTVLRQTREKLQGYSGPYTPASERTLSPPYLTDRHLSDWLQQFETDPLISCAIRVLGHLKLVGRKEIAENLKRFLAENPEFSDASICPLGEARDSGPIAAYFSGDVADARIVDLQEALASTTAQRHIIFVDDFLGSGHQAVSILEALLGEPLSYDSIDTRLPFPQINRDEFLGKSTISFVMLPVGVSESQL